MRWGPGRGQPQGVEKKTPRPGPLSGAGQGIRAGDRRFRGAGGPVTNTTCHYSPFCPSTSGLRPLAPYCFNTAAMSSAAHPLGFCLLLMASLHDRGYVHGCLCLYVGSSCLPPLSPPGYATPPHHSSGVPGNRLRPATHSHKCWLGYRSPSLVCAHLGFLGYMLHIHLPLLCGAVLCPCAAGSIVFPPFPTDAAHRRLWVGWL